MNAGKATPADARMMWKPSVNGIWLRAASSCEASITMAGGSAPRHAGLGLCQAGLELLGAGAVDVRDGLADGVDERLVDGGGAAGVIHRDHAARARRQRGVHLLADPAFEPVLGELPHHPAGHRPDRSGGQQRRREQADDEPGASADLRALAALVVPALDHRDLAVDVLLYHHDAVERDRLVLGELQYGVEVALREVLEEVRRDQDVLLVVAHGLPPYAVMPRTVWPCEACSWRSCSSWASRCGATSKTTFLTVPVNANGALSA